MYRKRSNDQFLPLHLAVLALSLLAGSASAVPTEHPDPDDRIYFEITHINGESVPYLSVTVSPTDGDILDRGLRRRVLNFRLTSEDGDKVQCVVPAQPNLDKEVVAFATTCPGADDDDTTRCFELEFDTRKVPNGPVRLVFLLSKLPHGEGEQEELIDRIDLVIHVLNTRLEVDRNGIDSVRLRLSAGVVSPTEVKDYRFALFAAGSTSTGSTLPEYSNPVDAPPEHVTLGIPIGGPTSDGLPGAVKLYPADGIAAVPHAAWPDAMSSVHLQVSWADLSAIAAAKISSQASLVAAVYDGEYWHWSSVATVSRPKAPNGLAP